MRTRREVLGTGARIVTGGPCVPTPLHAHLQRHVLQRAKQHRAASVEALEVIARDIFEQAATEVHRRIGMSGRKPQSWTNCRNRRLS